MRQQKLSEEHVALLAAINHALRDAVEEIVDRLSEDHPDQERFDGDEFD